MSRGRAWTAAAAVLVSVPAFAAPAFAAPQATRGVQSRPMAQADAALYRRQVAVVVGIDDYRGAGWDLSHAVHDATAVAALLEARFAFDEVHLLTGEGASRALVAERLQALAQTAPDDVVVIFWAGHGVERTTVSGVQEAFLVPQDGDPRPSFDPAVNLSFAELRRLLLEQVPARHKLVVLDACYGGALSVRGAGGAADATLSQLLARPALQVLTAGQADEVVLDGGRGGHSVFSAALLDALEAVEDYRTASELAAEVQRQVREEAWALGHRQTPHFARLAGSGDVVLVPRGDPEARAPRVAPRRLPAAWGAAVPGLVHPEPGRPPGVVARAGARARPLASARVRTADADGVRALSEELVLLTTGVTAPLGRWRLDAAAGAALGPDAETATVPVGGVAVAPPSWRVGAGAVGVQGRAAWGSEWVGDGVGVAMLAGGGRQARWTVDAGLVWPRPGLGAGVRWGTPQVALLASGVGTVQLAGDQWAELRPAVGVDLAARGGLRLALVAEMGVTAAWVGEGGVAWLQDPDALARLSSTPDGLTVSGPGVRGAPTTGPGWLVSPAPGPAIRLELARSVR